MDPRLYILMRTDLDSMNAGKAMAQAAHAANAFVVDVARVVTTPDTFFNVAGFKEWAAQTDQGFGTTITLAASDEEQLNKAVASAKRHGLVADLILDPTYPVRDGHVTHLVPVITCAYVFVPDTRLCPDYIAGFSLHP